MKQLIPELLAPAGSPEALDAAIAEGADAVYLGLKTFNARLRSANFAYSQFEGALRTLHRMGKRVYVTVNTVFEQREADRVYQLLRYLASVGPDGIIVQDFGILSMCSVMAREFPHLKIHASTQMNIASARGANALSRHGVSRVVLSRELSLPEIKSIADNTNVELEVFVHGALCASMSGLCLFSSYLGGKSANRGLCTQACRRLYICNHAEDIHGGSGEANSGYFFSPCDLSLIAQVPLLAEAGVKSLKIEGRMKSAEYVGTVVSAYRLVLDSLDSGTEACRNAIENAREILRNDFARPKTEYFFTNLNCGAHGNDKEDTINTPCNSASSAVNNSASFSIFRPEQDGGTGIRLGTIQTTSGSGSERRALIKSEGAFTLAPGDSVRLHKADDSRRQPHKLTFARNKGGRGVKGNNYLISIPDGFEVGDSVYLIQTKAMTKRYPQIIPKDLSRYKRQPGREKAPLLPRITTTTTSDKKHNERQQSAKKHIVPEGIFASVASVEDLYVVQSVKPASVILPINQKTVKALLADKPLPFKPADLILALNPWFPQEQEAFLAPLPAQLIEKGYRSFILNNPGHFSLFRDIGMNSIGVNVIAGPWLYTFNSWAASFTAKLGARYHISPLENNRQNLERTVPPRQRSQVLVTLFAWPPLFRIKTGNGSLYDFKNFTDSRNETFTLINGDGSAVVIPQTPFCITDKRPFLTQAGFKRFIVDFSAGMFDGSFPLKKKFYKEVMQAAQESLLPGHFSRFNWKNGFFTEKDQKNSQK